MALDPDRPPRGLALGRALTAAAFTGVAHILVLLALLLWVVGVDSIENGVWTVVVMGVILGGAAFLPWLLLSRRSPEQRLARTATIATLLTLLCFLALALIVAIASVITKLAAGSALGNPWFEVVYFPLLFTLLAVPATVLGAILTVVVRNPAEQLTRDARRAIPASGGEAA